MYYSVFSLPTEQISLQNHYLGEQGVSKDLKNQVTFRGYYSEKLENFSSHPPTLYTITTLKTSFRLPNLIETLRDIIVTQNPTFNEPYSLRKSRAIRSHWQKADSVDGLRDLVCTQKWKFLFLLFIPTLTKMITKSESEATIAKTRLSKVYQLHADDQVL